VTNEELYPTKALEQRNAAVPSLICVERLFFGPDRVKERNGDAPRDKFVIPLNQKKLHWNGELSRRLPEQLRFRAGPKPNTAGLTLCRHKIDASTIINPL
jgi:hypothetical protein